MSEGLQRRSSTYWRTEIGASMMKVKFKARAWPKK